MDTPVFECRSIRKEFGATVALKDVSIRVNPAEVVGLIGENGAGKSTLLKIIMGFQPQTAGVMLAHGKPYAPRSTIDASKAGMGMVYQEQSLMTNLTVAQNIFFGREDRFALGGVAISRRKMNAAAKEALAYIGNATVQPQKTVLDYNFSLRQQIEIAKVLSNVLDSGVKRCLIMLDEPTSLLSDGEVNRLFELIHKVKARGHSVVFVSHRLDEVLSISDRIYVFKDGDMVGEMENRGLDEGMLYKMMVGKESGGEFYRIGQQITPSSEVLLEVQGLGMRGIFKDVSFRLHKGEILGICGVIGSGKEEVCGVICGDRQATSGTIAARGRPCRFRAPWQAQRRGIITVPKERGVEGMVGLMSVEDNIALSSLRRISRHGVIRKNAIRELYLEWKKRLSIKSSHPEEYMKSLSGGNAQKVVFSRVIASGCEILVLNHPTRGVDVGAKGEIYAMIRSLAAEGKGILLLCDTLEEAIGLSNRILVMKDGLITKCVNAARDQKPSKLEIIENMM